MTAINFEQGFDDYYAAHPKVWKHDRSQTVGGSEIFGCLRKAWFAKRGTPKDKDYEDDWGALERGNIIEDHFVVPRVKWMLERIEGARILYAGQSTQRTFIDDASRMSVTPDGLVIGVDDDALTLYGVPSLGGTGCFNFEIKSIDPRVNLREEKGIHRGQVQVQMGMTREQTRYKPNFALIIYVDASFLSDIDFFVVPFEQTTFDVAKLRSLQVYETERVADLLPEGKIDGICKYCPYRVACSEATGEATPSKGDTNVNELPLALATEFESLLGVERANYHQKKDIEHDHSEASEKLKAWFREIGVKRAQAGTTSASLTFQRGRKTLDIEAMRDDGIDVDKYYKQGPGFDVLRINEKGTSADQE